MSKSFIHILLLFGLSWSAIAAMETETGEKRHHGRKLEQLGKELGLTDDQKIQIKNLFKANKDKIKALKEANREQFKATLTPEQKNGLKSLYKQRGEVARELNNELKSKKIQDKIDSK